VSKYQGAVKWFNNAKGYGFIGRGEGPDVFCHYSAIQRDGYKSFTEGEAVTFEIVHAAQGPQPEQVIRAVEQGKEYPWLDAAAFISEYGSSEINSKSPTKAAGEVTRDGH
jgi:CspA family cold shock protein